MTDIEKAIKIVEGTGFGTWAFSGKFFNGDNVKPIILAALREKQERENPAPLTLDELLAITEPTRLWSVGDHEPFYTLVEWIETPNGHKLHWISLDGGEEFIPEKTVRELCGGPYMQYYFCSAADALETQLTDTATLRSQLSNKDIELQALRNAANQFKRDLASVTAERDAAVADLALVADCRTCGNRTGWCDNPDACKGYEWRGLTELPGAKSDA